MSRPLEFPSGNWTGFYLESHRPEPGWMHLYLACDPQGTIRGEGVDYVGHWSLQGAFDRTSGRCEWIKSYIGKHQIAYSGLLGPDGIEGVWSKPPFLSGSFRIWPEQRADLTDRYLREGVPRFNNADSSSVLEDLETPLLA